MRTLALVTLVCLALALAACGVRTGASTPASAPAATLGSLQIVDPWARAAALAMPKTDAKTSGGAGAMASGPNSAAYMTIRNTGGADRLLAVQCDAAQAVELHTMEMKDNVMQMRPVEGIDVPANGQVELKPGGYHVMLIGLKRELKTDETITVKLRFEKAGEVEVPARVRTQ